VPDDRVFESRQGQELFPLSTTSRPAVGHTKPPTQFVPGFFPGDVSPGEKLKSSVK
jgi:hypothetical protein